MFSFSRNFFSLSFATLLLIILAGCSATKEAVNKYNPVDSLSALECQTGTTYESTDHLGCVERIFQDIPLTSGYETQCVALDTGRSPEHMNWLKAVAESLSDVGSSCDAYGKPEQNKGGINHTVRKLKKSGFISFSYTPSIAPNPEMKAFSKGSKDGSWEFKDGSWGKPTSVYITKSQLLTDICFLVAFPNEGNKNLISLSRKFFVRAGIRVDEQYLKEILLENPKTCVILVTLQNSEATKRFNGTGRCDDFEKICLHTKGHFYLKKTGSTRGWGTSYGVVYLLATLNMMHERMPLGTKPKQVVDMALQCVYGFGANFTPTPGERLDLWCLREKLLQARAQHATSG